MPRFVATESHRGDALDARHDLAHSKCMASVRLPENQEDREVYLREHNARSFSKAVNDARHRSLDTVLMTVKGFAGEPDVLYVALNYAYHAGVAVTMAAMVEQDGQAVA